MSASHCLRTSSYADALPPGSVDTALVKICWFRTYHTKYTTVSLPERKCDVPQWPSTGSGPRLGRSEALKSLRDGLQLYRAIIVCSLRLSLRSNFVLSETLRLERSASGGAVLSSLLPCGNAWC